VSPLLLFGIAAVAIGNIAKERRRRENHELLLYSIRRGLALARDAPAPEPSPLAKAALRRRGWI
jgi:hypothetical protein